MRRTERLLLVVTCAAALLAVAAPARAINPPPSLAAPRQFAAGTTPAGLVVRDFDGDGRADIASVDHDSPYTFTVRRKNAFAPGTPYAQQTYTNETFNLAAPVDDMTAGNIHDFDGGFPDLVFCSGGNLVVVTNDGPAGAQPSGQLQFTAGTPMPAGAGIHLDHVRTATWDGDTTVDLVATGHDAQGHGVLAVFLNGAGGVRGAFSPATVTQLSHPVFGLCIGDFNNDFKPDVAVVYRDDSRVGVLVNPGDGSGNAAGETLVTVPTFPESVTPADLTDAVGSHFSDLVIVGSNRSADSTKNQTTLTVVQDAAPLHSPSPVLGAPATFVLGAVAGPAALLPADASVRDLDADGLSDIVVANPAKDTVTIVALHPTLAGGLVTSWGTPETYDFPCNPQPARAVFADADGIDADADVVTANTGGNGINVMTGGAPVQTPLAAATNLTVSGKKTGKAFLNGLVAFSCRSSEPSSVVGLRIRVQSTETPDDEGSWTDVPGAIDLPQEVASGKFVSFVGRPLPPGTQTAEQLYFRTVTSAPGFPDGIDSDPPASNSPTRYVGPYSVAPTPARLSLTSTLSVQGGSGSLVRAGDTVLEHLVVANGGDADAKDVYVVGLVPNNCVLGAAPGAALTAGNAVVFGPFTVPGGGSAFVEFTCTVQSGGKLGTTIRTAKCLAGSAKKATAKVKGASAVSNSLELASALSMTGTASPSPATPGTFVTFTFDVTNFGTTPLGATQATDTLPDDLLLLSGVYLDAGGNVISGQVPSFAADGRTIAWSFTSLAGHETRRVQTTAFVKYDHARTGQIADAAYRATAGSVSSAASPPAVTVPMSGSGPAHAPSLRAIQYFYTGNEYFTHPQLGFITRTTNGATVDVVVGFWNDGDADAPACALDGVAPSGTDIVPGSFQYDGDPVTPQTGPNGAYHVDLGYVTGDGGAVAHTVNFKVTVRDEGAAGAPKVGGTITSGFPGITCPALIGVTYAAPHLAYALVARPAQIQVDKSVDRTAIGFGQVMTHSFRLTNLGDVVAAGLSLKLSLPKFEGFVSAITASGLATVDKTGVTVNVGDLAPGASCDCSITVKLNAKPADARDVILNTTTVVGPGTKRLDASDEKAAAVVTYHQSTEATLCDDGNCPRLFVVAAAPLLHPVGEMVDVTLIVGNSGGVAANGITLTTALADGVTVDKGSTSSGGKAAGNLITWKFTSQLPHSATAVTFRLVPGANFHDGDSFSMNSLLTAGNAPAKLAGRVVFTLRSDPLSHVGDDLRRALTLAGTAYGGGNSVIDSELASAGPDSLSVTVAGADLMVLSDGAYVVPLGGGHSVEFGRKALFEATDGILGLDHNAFLGFPTLSSNVFLTGDPSKLRLVGGLSCGGVATVDDAIQNPGTLQACGAASLICAGGLNLFDATGTQFVDNGTATGFGSVALAGGAANGLTSVGDAPLVGGTGAVLAAGAGGPLALSAGRAVSMGDEPANCVKGGGIVSAGGGNVLGSASLIGHDGASLIGHDGASLIGHDGASLIGDHGSELIGASGSTLIGHDGASLIGHDGASLITSDGGSLIGHDGASLRTNATGNAFTRAGGN